MIDTSIEEKAKSGRNLRTSDYMSFFVRKTSKWRPISGHPMTVTLPKSYRVRDGLVPVGVTHRRRRRRRRSRRRRMRNGWRWRRRRRRRMLATEVPVNRGRQGRPWGRWGRRRSVSIGVSRRGRRTRVGTDGWNREGQNCLTSYPGENCCHLRIAGAAERQNRALIVICRLD